jgi:hypothetical protein
MFMGPTLMSAQRRTQWRRDVHSRHGAIRPALLAVVRPVVVAVASVAHAIVVGATLMVGDTMMLATNVAWRVVAAVACLRDGGH